MASSWQIIKLGEVLTERRETPSPESIETGEISIVSKIGFNEGKIELRNETNTKTGMILIRPGDLVISGINAAKGAIAIYSETAQKPIAATIHYGAYIPNQERVNIKYLWWFLRSATFRDIVQHHIPGGIKTELKAKRFLAVPVPLPPLTEQRRIVGRIEALAARVAEAQSLRREASEEAEFLAFATARKIFSNLDSKIIELGDLVDESRNGIQTGPFGAQLGSGDFLESGHPVITIGNVQYSGLETGKLKFISEEKAKQLSRFLVQEGDILFARMGTVGRCCVVPKEAEGWVFNYHLIRVALDKSRVEPRYIHWLIRASQDIEDKLDDKIRGATREGVNSKIVASLPCRVPPLEEQRRLVAYLDGLQEQVSALRAAQAETEKELSALMPSVLDRAFKGKL
jgi:type I restriction enzyme S subunit